MAPINHHLGPASSADTTTTSASASAPASGELSPHAHAIPKGTPTQLFIDGNWIDAAGAKHTEVIDPATGKPLCMVADASPEDGMAALEAASKAQKSWAKVPTRERAELLRRAFDLTIERTEELATLMTLEMGKPLAEARGEVTYGAEFLRWFSEEAPRIAGRYQSSPEGNMRQLVTKRPVGPCLFITPWNFPLAMATRKTAPALAAGCTVVLKPAHSTPLTALYFAKILEEAGVPAGVFNVIVTSTSSRVTGPMIADKRLRKLSFTGSTQVGQALLRESAENVLRTSMELGGNAPFIVFADADIDAAVEGAFAAKMRNMGEACVAANRMLVHRDVADEFTAKLAKKFAALKVSAGMEEGADVGPIIDARARDTIHQMVEEAKQSGAQVLTGGAIPEGSGYFYPPTVLADVARDATILTQEIFGPVAPVTTFETEAEALEMANDSEVGLAGYVYTQDMARILRIPELLEVGMIGINRGTISNAAAPFGGVKQSGLGREGGIEGIEEFLETVYTSLPDPFEG